MLAKEMKSPLVARVEQQQGVLRFVPSLYKVALMAVLGAILIVAVAPRLDTDFWWHLKDGQYIALNHVIPSHDFMSYTFRGHSWTDHEWLAELGLYGLFRLGGLWGPIVFFALIICTTFGLVYLQIVRRGVNQILALFVVAAAYMASSASWGPRIQMMTLFFLSLYALALHAFVTSGNRRLLVVFPVLMLLWTNIHGGFVLGLAVLAITCVGELLNRLTHHDDALSADGIKALAIAFAATFAVTIVNPNGFRQLLYPLTFILPNAYTNLIQESASPNFHMPVMMVFEAMLLLLIAALMIGRQRPNWTHLLIILAFTHLAFSQVRNVALWSVVVSPFLALYLQQALPALREQFPQLTYRRRPVAGRMASILNAVLLVLVLLVYVVEATHFINAKSLKQAERDNYPTGAIAYMRAHPLPQRHVFVSYGWGGYLLWNLFPAYRDYMDSRADTLYNNKILHGYLDMYSASPTWKSQLKHFGVQDVLVERNAPLAQVLAQDKSWHLRYHDNESVLYTQG